MAAPGRNRRSDEWRKAQPTNGLRSQAASLCCRQCHSDEDANDLSAYLLHLADAEGDEVQVRGLHAFFPPLCHSCVDDAIKPLDSSDVLGVPAASASAEAAFIHFGLFTIQRGSRSFADWKELNREEGVTQHEAVFRAFARTRESTRS